MGKKSKIIMGLAVGAMIPAMLTGCGHKEHDPKDEWKTDATYHWHECEGEKCDEQLNKAEHEAATVYSHNDTHHWKECTECEYDLSLEQHSFTKESIQESFFKEETDTTVTYYKSCECGQKGIETFTVNKTTATLENISTLDKPYDALAVSAPTYQTNSNGAATIEYKVKNANDNTYTITAPVDAGDYTVRVSIASNRVYSAVSETKDFTISKCEISDLSQGFLYNKLNTFTVDIPTEDVPESGISLEVTFDSSNVGATVEGVRVLKDGVETQNYEVKNYTAVINPYIISGLEKDFVYNGECVQTVELPDAMNLPDNNVSMEITFESADVDSSSTGARVLVGGVESENYEVDNYTANIVQKILRFEDVYVKNYDETNIVRFDFNNSGLDGVAAAEGVYVEFEALEYGTPENLPRVNAGYYSQVECGLYKFYTSDDTETDNYTFDDNHFQGEWSGFKLWILDTNPLVLEVTNRFHIEEDYILTANIRQGSVKVGDNITLPGTPDKVYEVLKIEKLHKEQGQATVGEEVGIYIDGMAELSEVPSGSLLYTQGRIPEMATTFFANIYAKTEDEGGRKTPFSNGYAPDFRGFVASQEGTIDIIDVYGKDDTMVYPGDRALVKITLTNALPASLLENLEFTMAEGGKTTVTGVGVDYVESQNSNNAMVETDKFTTEAEKPMVIRLTNTRSEPLSSLTFYTSNGSGGGNYLTNFTFKLYDSSFNLIEGTHNNESGTFTKTTDASEWSLAAGDTCYIVITTTSAIEDVFAWLS